jgi:Resolvase, N terminal domain
LRDRAVALGWPLERIRVLDCDLGKSGSQSAGREGFQKLVGEVALGKAGLVMGLEVSRLARNSAGWHRLIELCSLAGTLILDEDGSYDPANFNDRLLLGLNRPDSYSTSYSTSRGSVNLLEILLGHRLRVRRTSHHPVAAVDGSLRAAT